MKLFRKRKKKETSLIEMVDSDGIKRMMLPDSHSQGPPLRGGRYARGK